jgi:hypothetical protein
MGDTTAGGPGYVVVDGYKRVRCLKRLCRDGVVGVVWEMSEPDALIFRQMVHTEGGASALEQGWLLRALHEGHDLGLGDLARRFDRSVSWVSRRLALARELPEAIQDRVREGGIVPHAAMRYLVPLARANERDCLRLEEAVREAKLSTRQMGQLYQTYMGGNDKTRELVVTEPLLVLRVEQQARKDSESVSDGEAFVSDLHTLGALARRAYGRLRRGLSLLGPDRERAAALFARPRPTSSTFRTDGRRGMLDHATRAAILTLQSRGEGIRQIARALRISRGAVRKVLSSGTPEVPLLDRPSRAQPHKEQIKELLAQCKGNLVRVHEELGAC